MMRLNILKSVHRLARRSLLTVGVALVLCCHSGKETATPAPFTEDELYLIESYARIRNAQSYYPDRPMIAESLFTLLDGGIDSLRVAETVQQINHTTQRWILIFQEIEDRMQRDGAPPLEG